ncbi:MAG: DUF5693 family protein [Thermoanaerobacterales bacterium]|nr:DUF5693 family protein [Thermoanaerobacterales bacterium]
MRQPWYRTVTLLILIIAVCAAGYLAWQRHVLETRFRTVEVALIYDEVAKTAALGRMSIDETLARFKDAGVTTVLFKEPSVDDARLAGMFEVRQGAELLADPRFQLWAGRIGPLDTCLIARDETTIGRLRTQFSFKIPAARAFYHAGGLFVLDIPAPYSQVKDLGVGFDPAALAAVERAGLRIVPQVRTWPGTTPAGLERFGRYLAEIPNLSAVAFNDKTIPGFPVGLGDLARALEGLDVPVVSIEFAPQAGVWNLGARLSKRVVLAHTISEGEMEKYTIPRALDRYTLAAAERNVRLLLVRLFFVPERQTDLVGQNLDFIGALAGRLRNEGLALGPASSLPPWHYPRVLPLLAGLGVVAGGVLLLERFGAGRWAYILGAAAGAAWAPAFAAGIGPAVKLAALGAVVVFPALGVIALVPARGLGLGQSLGRLVLIVGTALIGSLFVVALLGGTKYMLKLDAFSGVKLAYALPLALVAAYFAFPPDRRGEWWARGAAFLNQPVRVVWALAGAVLAAAAAIYILRTGNDAQALISPLELKVRALLDQVLLVRPRTKEFALGYPLLLLLLRRGYRNDRYLPLAVLAAIGPVSAASTFLHLHTPLAVSLLRTFNGLWLGALIGLGLIAAWMLGERLWARLETPARRKD